METLNRTLQGALFLLLTSIVACTSDQDENGASLTLPDTYQKYRNDGISLAYPGDWSLSYDDSPSIYASRSIGLDISDFSTATVLVSEDKKLALEYVTNRFLNEFQVEQKDTIDNFTRTSNTVGGFAAETATWDDYFLGETKYELTVAKVRSKPHDVFVVFSLSDDDIDETQDHKERFLKSIRIQ